VEVCAHEVQGVAADAASHTGFKRDVLVEVVAEHGAQRGWRNIIAAGNYVFDCHACIAGANVSAAACRSAGLCAGHACRRDQEGACHYFIQHISAFCLGEG
jgi:hypothetical protein